MPSFFFATITASIMENYNNIWEEFKMMKLLKLWSKLGVKVMKWYVPFIEKVGDASIFIATLMLLGFTIPWSMVYIVLITLNIIQGWFVYDLTFKEQYDCVKEGFIDGVNNPDKYLE